MKNGRKREIGRFQGGLCSRNLPKLVLAGEKKIFGVYVDGMKARFVTDAEDCGLSPDW